MRNARLARIAATIRRCCSTSGDSARKNGLTCCCAAWQRCGKPILPPHIANFKVALVGDGQCRSELEELTEHLGLKDRVKFVGGVPHNNVGQWYAAGDIFTMPSPAETQGLVLVEAMSAGLPCITVDQGGPRELVLQGETGLRIPLDADAFSHALDCLLRSPEIRHSFGERGRQHAHAFTPEAMTRRVMTVYLRALRLPNLANDTSVHRLAVNIQKRAGRNAGASSRRRPRPPPPRLKFPCAHIHNPLSQK